MMASTPQHLLLSPAELAYLHTSLSLQPPLRPDGRTPTQFRPLVAETGVLPGTNGSARVCFADGTEAIVGVKAEVEKTAAPQQNMDDGRGGVGMKGEREDEQQGSDEWVALSIEIPGYRDDDSGTVFMAAMLSEALLADGAFVGRLKINNRFHWTLYLDILLISPPLSYPLPLLSLTTHLALLATRLPRLISEGDEDPLFDDDWHAAPYLYPRSITNKWKTSKPLQDRPQLQSRPPITLLVASVGPNLVFDPSKEELAVADTAIAVSVSEVPSSLTTRTKRDLRLLSVRTVDPPSRLTPPGVPNSANAAFGPAKGMEQQQALQRKKKEPAAVMEVKAVEEGVWRAPRGGVTVGVMRDAVRKVLEDGGVAWEVMDGLQDVELT